MSRPKRGSERRGSSPGSTFKYVMKKSRFSNAFSSHPKAWSLSPSAAYAEAMKNAGCLRYMIPTLKPVVYLVAVSLLPLAAQTKRPFNLVP